ncbi:MAG: segregation/condensation protein A [Alphaproteobacteria bacterium]|nr:segregation/condensation protein A [Alphaproteobacteria bacterium]
MEPLAASDASFEDQPPEDRLVLDLDGFEGPIDVLLTLARDQKVDLTKIKIVPLVDQYLAFISQARKLKLEIAADYLVMAAWLAYLKSRLLLPEPPEDEPSGEEMAANLAWQLQRLEAMQAAGVTLFARPRLGWDVFRRGMPEVISADKKPRFEATLYDLLKAYADQKRRVDSVQMLRIAPTSLYSVEDALERLEARLGKLPDWETLVSFLPEDLRDPVVVRSATASTFAASLELAKQGRLLLRQLETFGPIYLKSAQMEPS